MNQTPKRFLRYQLLQYHNHRVIFFAGTFIIFRCRNKAEESPVFSCSLQLIDADILIVIKNRFRIRNLHFMSLFVKYAIKVFGFSYIVIICLKNEIETFLAFQHVVYRNTVFNYWNEGVKSPKMLIYLRSVTQRISSKNRN